MKSKVVSLDTLHVMMMMIVIPLLDVVVVVSLMVLLVLDPLVLSPCIKSEYITHFHDHGLFKQHPSMTAKQKKV